MRFIGDIHGEVGPYKKLIETADESVQVGDFGVGFPNENVVNLRDYGAHKFIRGNHDDPAECKRRFGWIPDGTYDFVREIMYVGGAWSIDWNWRTPGYSWWPDEELSEQEFEKIEKLYSDVKPRVMVTHDCPKSIAYELFIKSKGWKQYDTRTAIAFERLLEIHKPDLWIFGHWHESRKQVLRGVEFVCLAELEYMDLIL